jgi:signal transduction histidine kinase
LQVAGGTDVGTLQKIEHSGRQALVEMRRLLGVLRQPGDQPEPAGLAPQPGIASLDVLADGVRAAGVPVRLAVHGDPGTLPAAADISAYRIVQEALTNVLKHAGQASADVVVTCRPGDVLIEVTDDGTAAAVKTEARSGHGLIGMRERVALFGGDFTAAPLPAGGYAVSARLPLGTETSDPGRPGP